MRVEMSPYSLDPVEHHHVANLCSSLVDIDPSLEVTRFERSFPIRRHPADVIHVHWPEHAIKNEGLARYSRPLRLLASLWWCRLRGSTLVHTAHNLSPHDLDLTRFDRWYLRSFDRLVDHVLLASGAGTPELLEERPELRRATSEIVPLGLPLSPVPAVIDQDEARQTLGLAPDPPVVAFVGRVMRYKGIPALVDVWDASTSQLLVAGEPMDADLAAELDERLLDTPGALLMLRHLDEAELINAVTAASVIVLPFVRILNSGSALLALSLGRRVLVPDLPTFRELQSEVGAPWVHLFAGARPTSEDLCRAIHDPPTGRPDLADHTWSSVSARTLAAYRRTVQERTGRHG